MELCGSQEQELLLSQHHKWNTGLPHTRASHTNSISFTAIYCSYFNPLPCLDNSLWAHKLLSSWRFGKLLLFTINYTLSEYFKASNCCPFQTAMCTYCPRASVCFFMCVAVIAHIRMRQWRSKIKSYLQLFLQCSDVSVQFNKVLLVPVHDKVSKIFFSSRWET